MSSSEKRSRQTRSSSFHKDRLILFLTGCALGVACFLWVYGASVINPLYDAWLFNTDMDLKQHYIGWCHYRMSDWHFPVGLIDTLSYPTSVSVIYTDSIPIVALIFKLFRNILPLRFQYFGLFGLFSFMLMGGISSQLIYELICDYAVRGTGGRFSGPFSSGPENRPPVPPEYTVSAAASLVYILGFTVLQRMFYHTALGAQWIIVLALYIWVKRRKREYTGFLSSSLVYALMGILCVGIHTYYVPMAGSILLAASAERIIKLNKGLINAKSPEIQASGGFGGPILSEAVNLAAFCIAGILTLYVFGGFYGASSGYGEGFGSFISNLNTFINPLYGSIVLRPMKLYYDWQYEGYGYLGIGVLICILIIIWGCIYNIHIKSIAESKRPAGIIRAFMAGHSGLCTGAVLFALDLLLAVLPTMTFSDKKIIGIPMPQLIRNVFGIFRSNGRFIWVPVYLVMTGAIVYTYRILCPFILNLRKGKSILIKTMLLLMLLQVLDTTKAVKAKQEYFRTPQIYTNIWTKAPFPAGDIKYREFAFLYNDNDIMMDTAFYAYLTGKRLNNYYYARNIDDEINKNIRQWRNEVLSGFIRDDVIYICKQGDPLAGLLKSESKENGLKLFDLDGEHVVFVR